MSTYNITDIDGDLSVGRNVTMGGDLLSQGSALIKHDLTVEGLLRAKNIKIDDGGSGGASAYFLERWMRGKGPSSDMPYRLLPNDTAGGVSGVFSIETLLWQLDFMVSADTAADVEAWEGFFRGEVNGIPFGVRTLYTSPGGHSWVQVVEGSFSLTEEGSLAIDMDAYRIFWRQCIVNDDNGDWKSVGGTSVEDIKPYVDDRIGKIEDKLNGKGEGEMMPYRILPGGTDGRFADTAALVAQLDTMCGGEDARNGFEGFFRANINGIAVEVISSLTSPSQQAWVQVLAGAVKADTSRACGIATDMEAYHILWRNRKDGEWHEWQEIGALDVDNANMLLRISRGGATYVCDLRVLAAPPAPQLSAATDLVTTADTASMTITNKAGAGKTHYTTDGTDPRTSATAKNSTAATVNVPLSVSQTAASTAYTVKAATQRDGEWSDTASATYTTRRKVATPAISASGDKYTAASEKRTVTITCDTAAAVIHYTTDGSEPTAASQTYTQPLQLSATATVKAVATHATFVASATASLYVEIGAPMTYYEGSDKETLTAADIPNLANHLRLDGIATSTLYPITLSADNYVWICQKNTLNPDKVFASPDAVINYGMAGKGNTGGWNCYRSDNLIAAGQTSIYLKP